MAFMSRDLTVKLFAGECGACSETPNCVPTCGCSGTGQPPQCTTCTNCTDCTACTFTIGGDPKKPIEALGALRQQLRETLAQSL